MARPAASTLSWRLRTLRHAQRFAAGPAGVGAALDLGPIALLFGHARESEAVARRRCHDAARACKGALPLRRLFEWIGTEEAGHYDDLTRRL